MIGTASHARHLLAEDGARLGLEASYLRFIITRPGRNPVAVADEVVRTLIAAQDLDVITEFPVREYALSSAGRARLAQTDCFEGD